jgi:hypothetical protein
MNTKEKQRAESRKEQDANRMLHPEIAKWQAGAAIIGFFKTPFVIHTNGRLTSDEVRK